MKKKERKEVVESVSIGLRKRQKTWLKKNPRFKLSKFVQDKLDGYIKTKEALKELIK